VRPSAVVERLLAKGADVTAETLDGFSALDLAGTIECLASLPLRDVEIVLGKYLAVLAALLWLHFPPKSVVGP
jgi:hypothetical protein